MQNYIQIFLPQTIYRRKSILIKINVRLLTAVNVEISQKRLSTVIND